MYSHAITEPWYQDAIINNTSMPTRRGGKDSSEYRWNLFIEPLIEKDGIDRRFIELGSNAGFYLRKSRSLGFESIGVENNPLYVAQARYWEEKEPIGTKTIDTDLNKYDIPVAHTVLLANVIYYLSPEQVTSLIHVLRKRALNVIVISRHESLSRIKYPCEKEKICQYFSEWEVVEGGEDKRHWSALFKSPKMIELPISKLVIYDLRNPNKGEKFQSSFSEMVELIGDGRPFDIINTEYWNYFVGMPSFKRMKYIKRGFNLFKSVKKNRLTKPLLIKKHIDDKYRVFDGNHRLIICDYLGIKRLICLVLGIKHKRDC